MSENGRGEGFEQKLEKLENLVNRMENGGMKLEELLKEYSEGIRLSKELAKELDTAQAGMQILSGGELKTEEPADGL